jgi:CheY-specific phosphatase CheX
VHEQPDFPIEVEGNAESQAAAPSPNAIADAFARIGARVLEREIGGPATWVSETEQPVTVNLGVKALVGMAGSFRGSVTYAMDRETARSIYARMSGDKSAAFDELAHSAIGELANMISGRGTIALERLGYSCDITPPVLIIGEGVRINTVANRHEYAHIDCVAGRITIDAGIDT